MNKKLALFLRQRRGSLSYAVYARKLGITASSLFRLEHEEQSATLDLVQQICDRLKVDIQDIFPRC